MIGTIIAFLAVLALGCAVGWVIAGGRRPRP
jgi:uncharacterized membrane protein YedE/YeeE